MQFTQRHDIVFASRIIWIQPKRIRVADQADIAPAELAVRSRQMKVPVELLADSMHDNCVLGGWKFHYERQYDRLSDDDCGENGSGQKRKRPTSRGREHP